MGDFITDYIKSIENPDKIGWNGKVWGAPTLKGYDANQRGYGIDIRYNNAAKNLVKNRKGLWLTDKEATDLMNLHLLYITGVAKRKIKGFDTFSPKKQAAILGMLYRGDSVQSNVNVNEPNDTKFLNAVHTYYKNKGLNQRMLNSINFFSKYLKGGLIRKMLTAAGGPIRLSPEQIASFEYIPGMNNSGMLKFKKEGVLALQHKILEAKKKEEEIKSRMEMKPVLKKKASVVERFKGKKDKYEQQPQVVGMSGADPVGQFVVETAALGGLGKLGLWGAAKYAPKTWLGNQGRKYFVEDAFNYSFKDNVAPTIPQFTSLNYQPIKLLNESGSLKFFERNPSRISEAERLGIPRGDRGNLSLNLKLAIEDLALYKNSGQYRQVFRVTPDWENFGWNLDKSNPTFMLLFAKDGESMKGPFARVLLQTPTGKGVVSWNSEKNMGGYSSRMFKLPLELKYSPGEANMILDGSNYKVILTSPRIDIQDFMDDLANGTIEDLNLFKSLDSQLKKTIDKDVMKDFWINSRKVQRPGSYMSGDNGKAPLGSTLIEAFKKKQLYKTPLLERPINLLFIRRTGLSPDSYSSIIRLGNRDGSLRWGEGFTNWNNSAIENKFVSDALRLLKNGEITPEQYEKIFNEWSLGIGGRPLLWATIQELKIPVHPHPYIYAKKQGGKMDNIKLFKIGGRIRKMLTAAGGPIGIPRIKMNIPQQTNVVKESTNIQKLPVLKPKEIVKREIINEDWVPSNHDENSEIVTYPYLKDDKYILEFFLYDYAPRFLRETKASPKYTNLAKNIYKNTPIYFYNEKSGAGGYSHNTDQWKYNNFLAKIVNLIDRKSYEKPSVYLNNYYQLSRPTLIHELTHVFRQGNLGTSGNSMFNSKTENDDKFTFTRGSGYTNKETNLLNGAYNMNGYEINYDPLNEKGTTNTEVRYRIWSELYNKLGRRPTLQETDKYINEYNNTKLKSLIEDVNAYGYKMVENGLDTNKAKKAMIHVAQNNNKAYLLNDQTYYAKQGGKIIQQFKNRRK